MSTAGPVFLTLNVIPEVGAIQFPQDGAGPPRGLTTLKKPPQPLVGPGFHRMPLPALCQFAFVGEAESISKERSRYVHTLGEKEGLLGPALKERNPG